jgi:hypothetical protein
METFNNFIQLVKNSKNPQCKWSLPANQHTLTSLLPSLPPSQNAHTLPLPFNYGVLHGPINGITVVDVGDYTTPTNPKLLNEMMATFLKANACAVSIPSGGEHFYFQHDPQFGTTHNDPDILPLDIQCKVRAWSRLARASTAMRTRW